MEDLQKHIMNLREDFTKGSLDESEINNNPGLQFKLWMQQAIDSKVPEAFAVNLSTVSSEGKPSGRIVYLREFENNSFWFYTNYNSKKGNDMSTNPNIALTFFWPELERQIRIEGIVKKAQDTSSNAYFNQRPFESKIGAWASQQSQKLNTRADLEKRVEALKKEMPENTIQRPPFWGGYILNANYYEFWQGRKSRLHDRISYELNNDNWHVSRLAP